MSNDGMTFTLAYGEGRAEDDFVATFHPDYLDDDEWVIGISLSKYQELYDELERIKNAK